MPLRTRADYERAFSVVRDAINRWDPYGLISGGAPPDEWEAEVAKIVARVPGMVTPGDAANAVANTFAGAFKPDEFGVGECARVGEQIYKNLVSAGIIEQV